MVILTETRSETYVTEVKEWKILNSGHEIKERPNGGVAFMVKKDMKVSFNPISNRLVTLLLQLGNKHLALLGCYAPTESNANSQAKEVFYQQLVTIYKELTKRSQNIMVYEDFNCCIGFDAKEIGGKCVDPKTDHTETPENGLRLLSDCVELDLKIANTFFEKPERKRLTCNHPTGNGAMMDLLSIRSSPDMIITDIRVSRPTTT